MEFWTFEKLEKTLNIVTEKRWESGVMQAVHTGNQSTRTDYPIDSKLHVLIIVTPLA